MEKKAQKIVSGGVAGFASALLVLFLLGVAVAYSGAYNVAASKGHSAFGRWLLSTTMHNSVSSHAAGIEVPRMDDSEVARGAGDYKAMCEHCHAAPGVSRAEWAEGMLPKPPELAQAAAAWEQEEIFWIVKHGIKMSAMPAFGSTHGDEALWNITAFVDRLPGMTPATYTALADGGEQAAGGASGDHEHRANHAPKAHAGEQ
jgi:mono/diheme cytochrome c family protein